MRAAQRCRHCARSRRRSARRQRAERSDKLRRCLKAIGRCLGHCARECDSDLRWRERPKLRHIWRRCDQVLPQQAFLRGPRERRLSGQHFVEDAPKRVHIAATVELPLTGGLLRTHVRRRADDDSCAGERATVHLRQRARDAEVGDAGLVAREQDVVRLDVAMHDAECMCVGERVAHRARDVERVVDRQLPFAQQPGAQRLAAHKRHHVIEDAAGVA